MSDAPGRPGAPDASETRDGTDAPGADVRLVLFDIAGTLLRDDFTLPAYRATLESARLDADERWLRSRIGMRKASVFEELLLAAGRSEAEADDLAEAFDAAFGDALERGEAVALPGAIDAWNGTRAAGRQVGWISGFSRAVGDACIARLGLVPDVAVGSDEVASGRPAPDLVEMAMKRAGLGPGDAATVAVVGDTPRDLECATAAGCGLVIGVGHGTYALEELAGHPHTLLMPTLEAFERLFG